MLSLSSVAEKLGCSLWLVRRLVRSGDLEASKIGGRIYRVSPEALDRYLAERKAGKRGEADHD